MEQAEDGQNISGTFSLKEKTLVLWGRCRVFLKFCAASLSAAVLDIVLFTVFLYWIFYGCRDWQTAGCDVDGGFILSFVLARVISSAWNFTANRYIVFRRSGSERNPLLQELYKYYLLVICVLIASAVFSYILAGLLPESFTVAAKAAVDVIIFIAVYIIQKLFIFRKAK